MTLHLLKLTSLLTMLVAACSGLKSKSRSSNSEAASVSATGSTTGKPGDDSEGLPGYTEANNPTPINGTNLVEVSISVNCVKELDDESRPCNKVRLGAKVKVNAGQARRFAANSVTQLGIKKYFWTFRQLPANTSCQATGIGFDFNPLCAITNGTLIDSRIQATLSIEANDGSSFSGDSPDSGPSSGSVWGNFMLLDDSSGLTATKKTAYGNSVSSDGLQLFTQIWAVLKGNESYLESLKQVSYVTNVLYDGSGSREWNSSMDLCKNYLNSGDGTQKWRLPTEEELCNNGVEWGACKGGLSVHRIKNVPFEGRAWINPDSGSVFGVWSSTAVAPNYAWYVYPAAGNSYYSGAPRDQIFTAGTICVR